MMPKEAAAHARHDLGKYLSFQARWARDSGDVEELRAALRADIHETRRGPLGVHGAEALWGEFRPGFVAAGVELARLAPVDAAIAALSRENLSELDRAGLLRVADAAAACVILVRALAQEVEAAP